MQVTIIILKIIAFIFFGSFLVVGCYHIVLSLIRRRAGGSYTLRQIKKQRILIQKQAKAKKSPVDTNESNNS